MDMDVEIDKQIEKFPSELKLLKLGNNAKISVDNLPNKLETLIIGNRFFNSLDNLPTSLVELHLGDNCESSLDFLPANLRILSIGNFRDKCLDNLPQRLEILILTHPVQFEKRISFDNLPDSLILISVGYNFDYTKKSLSCINFCYGMRNIPMGRFPKNLKYFCYGVKNSETKYLSINFPSVEIITTPNIDLTKINFRQFHTK